MSDTKIIELKDVINAWVGNQVAIRKEETGDLDQITISLQKATFEQRDAPDEYLGDHILFLHGTAYAAEEGTSVELPAVTYEIPIDGITDIRIDSDIVSFETSRAQYVINKN
ncbi:hypothetical protein [Fictibacillus phosphorivorans]|uniref:hypothetical protein n=1 Tax=Fictibacillus phosphorivorans TaxID=1221500 RepID=UPI00203BC79C|nr:hypothetical protein [Fictibacillus phosphorivorans]MCM3717529.1 hypothetical protein [Fictibacillus phosphorivorans]MCM3775224.1 hypothetical protein [Fictibacillus phosphorivorans]